MELEVDVTNNAERKIVPSAEVITRNSFKGKPNDKEVQEPTTNAKVAKLKANQNLFFHEQKIMGISSGNTL